MGHHHWFGYVYHEVEKETGTSHWSREASKELAERLLNECATIDTPLFGHSDSKRTSRTFKKYVRLALPEREDIHLHSLRHTCCIELLRNGVPIYTVQRWMRHSSVQTTQNYADLLNSDVGKQVGKAFIQFIP